MAQLARRDIVVVGASAGGIDALLALVEGLPASLAASVFVVSHIPSDATSQLAQILGRAGKLPVEPARERCKISPGHIYVAVPNRHLLIEGDHIRVTSGPKENRVRPAVDALFRSAAYYCGPRTIGVILSGNLDDGTAGLWAIKDRGGVALVQSPEEAFYPSMPESAIAHVAVDHILSAARIPQIVTSLTREPVLIESLQPVVKSMETEIQIAEGRNGLQSGGLALGPISLNTCPTCHGVLMRIREGSILRYRCHTGHAFSLPILLAQLNEELADSLSAALRANDERLFLLQELEQQAKEAGDMPGAAQYAKQIETLRQWMGRLQDVTINAEMHGPWAIPHRPDSLPGAHESDR